jgi:hypothetical protein
MTSMTAPPQQAAGGTPAPTPPTGLQQQLAGLQATQRQAASMGIGPPPAQNQALPSTLGAQTPTQGGTSLSQLANQMAQSYGLSTRGDIFDAQGNPMMTPDQLAAASGGKDTMGSAAAKMNLIADALQKQQQQANMVKSEAALQTGLGLVQSRGRGSLATMQSGLYQNLASLYQNQQYHAADFSYFIQKEQTDIQQQMLDKQLKLQKKNAQMGFIGGLAMTGLGIATGNPGLIAGGVSSSANNAGSTGWF